jgi:hypothetical protein
MGKQKAPSGGAGGHRESQGRTAEARGRDPQAERPVRGPGVPESRGQEVEPAPGASWTRLRSSSRSFKPAASGIIAQLDGLPGGPRVTVTPVLSERQATAESGIRHVTHAAPIASSELSRRVEGSLRLVLTADAIAIAV